MAEPTDFVVFTVSQPERKVAINPALVRAVWNDDGKGEQTLIAFDEEHRIFVEGRFDDVVARLGVSRSD